MVKLVHRITSRAKRLIVHTPLLSLAACHRLIPRKVIGLCYHSVCDHPLEHIVNLYPQKPVAAFERHLVFLKERYRLLSYPELLAERDSSVDERRPAVFMTFDDGLRECFEVVRPLLKKHGIPCTFFVTTDFVGNARLLYRHKASLCQSRLSRLSAAHLQNLLNEGNSRWQVNLKDRNDLERYLFGLTAAQEFRIDELCAMAGIDIAEYLKTVRPYMEWTEVQTLLADGFTIGAHGKTHRLIGALPEHEQEEEILGSVNIVKDNTSQKEIPFAFPFSADGTKRKFLGSLRTKSRHLGLLFDLHGLKDDEDFLVNRVWCESKLFSPSNQCRMPDLLRNVYQAHVIESWFGE